MNWHAHTGDAKYHLGTSYTKTYPDGSEFTAELLANPSHLECINPLVMGKCRAENHVRHTKGEEHGRGQDRDLVVPILVHGDAAFNG